MLFIIEQKMCVDDRKVWVRDLEREKKFVILYVLMSWMIVEMKLRMCVIVLIRVGLIQWCYINYVRVDDNNLFRYKCWMCKIFVYWFD